MFFPTAERAKHRVFDVHHPNNSGNCRVWVACNGGVVHTCLCQFKLLQFTKKFCFKNEFTYLFLYSSDIESILL